mgnify:CR=1 FL=1
MMKLERIINEKEEKINNIITEKNNEELEKANNIIKEKNEKLDKILEKNIEQDIEIESINKKLEDYGYTEYEEAKKEINKLNNHILEKRNEIREIENKLFYYYKMEPKVIRIRELEEKINLLLQEEEKKNKQLSAINNSISKYTEVLRAIKYAESRAIKYGEEYNFEDISLSDKMYIDNLLPNVILKLNFMNFKELKKAMNKNNNEISKLLERYKGRYTTKTNKTIYSLMVIALNAELQNVLYNLKFEKLDNSIQYIKKITTKYLSIASEGNQTIAPTLKGFIGELEYFFINSIKIEYNYYVKKEQAKQEQMRIREQIRQENAERKALEIEKNKIQKEENKFIVEIYKITEKISNSDEQKEIEKLKERLSYLQAQLEEVKHKKEEIINLQNGKAGTVYIISNLGSFGDNVFKIGMTRRLDPMDRVNELGDASVPFKFDVHSFIFSEDAVDLETQLHKILNIKRVNKVNKRKEFFYTSIDELEKIVLDIQPTAEFNKTMLAEEFKQSQSYEEGYADDYVSELIDDEE